MKLSTEKLILNQILIIITVCLKDSGGAAVNKGKPEKKSPAEVVTEEAVTSSTLEPPVIFDKDIWKFPGQEPLIKQGFKKTRGAVKRASQRNLDSRTITAAPKSPKANSYNYSNSYVRSRRGDDGPKVYKDGFTAPRKKGASYLMNPIGTHVKLPKDLNLKPFDTVYLGLRGEDDEVSKTTTTTTEVSVTPTTEETTTIEQTTTIITTEETTTVETTTEQGVPEVTVLPTPGPGESPTGTEKPPQEGPGGSPPTEGPGGSPPTGGTGGSPPSEGPGGGSGGTPDECGSEGRPDVGGRNPTLKPKPTRPPLHPSPQSCKNIKLVGTVPEVTAKVGSYKGTLVSTSISDVLAFYGIPYAAPPVKELRFKRPQPPEMYYSTKMLIDASQMKLPCYSSRPGRTSYSITSGGGDFGKSMDTFMNASAFGSEDCLYMNIFVPKVVLQKQDYFKKRYPVIVWIHGEGFLSGNGDAVEENKATAHFVTGTNVIVVNIQYRMGVFGFLYLGVPEAPGNMGLLDQAQALQWIYSNIECFGGDPETITIMGHDMGAAFVGYHLISKISPSYFARAIMLGGSPNQPHVFESRQDAYRTAMEFASTVGCVNKPSIKTIHECLVNQDAETLWDVQLDFRSSTAPEHEPLPNPFVPTDNGHFLESSPSQILENNLKNVNYDNQIGNMKGKVCPILIGGVKNEGSTVVLSSVEGMEAYQGTHIPYDMFLRIFYNLFEERSPFEINYILHTYKNWEDLEDGLENQINIANAIGDYYFTCPGRKFSDFWSARGLNVYYYEFAHRPTSFNRTEWMGVVHGDEVDFFFGVPLLFPKRFTTDEIKLSERMVRLLVEFVKAGVLSSEWVGYGHEHPTYLELNTNALSEGYAGWNTFGPRPRYCDFWNEVFPALRAIIHRSVIRARNSDNGSNELNGSTHGGERRHGDSAITNATIFF